MKTRTDTPTACRFWRAGLAALQTIALTLALLVGLAAPAARAAADTYLVVELSGGTTATSYPVSYLSDVPAGGWTDDYKTTKLVLRKIPAGTFTMGSPTEELGRESDETHHEVTLTKGCYIGVFEVTQRQWVLVMGNNPSYLHNYATRPVEKVSYFDIRENPDNSAISPNWPATSAVHASSFMGKLRTKTGLATFDLPTESQWEYACRAGTATALNSGKNLTSIYSDANVAEVGRYWYNGGYWTDARQWDPTGGTALAGSYLPNQWGLYDMHGNVDEWCLDWHGTYPSSDSDPKGVTSGSHRVARGGGWNANADGCRSAERSFYIPETRTWVSLGLRVCSGPSAETTTNTVTLSISRGTPSGLIDLTVRNTAIGTVYDLQTSTNLVDWEILRQVTGQLEPQVISVETDGPRRFYRLSASTIVEPWSFFIGGSVLYDSRDGHQRLFRGLAYSGLEYGKVTHTNTPAVYPGDEGLQYFAPTQATFDLVRDLGANCVRLPFDWGRLVHGVADYQPGTPVTFDSEYLGYLQDAVRWAGEREIFVILDLHNSLEYAPTRSHLDLIRINENTAYRAFLAETWRALAQQFGTYPNVLGYEIVNEPNPQSGESNWSAIAQEIINAIREVDSRRIVFIDGYDFSGAQQWVLKSDALRNLTDSADRLVYAPHLYVDRDQNGTCDPGDEQPGVNWQYDLYEGVRRIVAWSQEVQRPILITEFGFLSLHNAWNPVLEELLTEYLDFHGIGAMLWNLETDIDASNQETYVYGGTGYVIGTYSNHINASYEGRREGDILADNLHNGFDLDIWNDSSDPRQDWTRHLKDGMGVDGGVALSLSGRDWGGGVNILYRDAYNQDAPLDVSAYESLSFMHKGAGVLVWVADAQGTDVLPEYAVSSHDAYTRVTIPLTEILWSEPSLNYIKIQIIESGSVLLDEIVLE